MYHCRSVISWFKSMPKGLELWSLPVMVAERIVLAGKWDEVLQVPSVFWCFFVHSRAIYQPASAKTSNFKPTPVTPLAGESRDGKAAHTYQSWPQTPTAKLLQAASRKRNDSMSRRQEEVHCERVEEG